LGVITQQILPSKIPIDSNLEQPKDLDIDSSNLPDLNEDQYMAMKALNGPGTYILHGKTGSGKTRVYIEEAIKTISIGKSVIVLSPEIGLSSQLFDNFKSVFKDRVIAVHSRQTPKNRINAWLRCLISKEPLVIIGPRSAIFSPLKELGLIVIDEMHDGAYKQEQAPHYQTIRVASALSNTTKSKLILGSATPSIADYFLAEQKSRPIIKLNKLAKGPSEKIEVNIVDLKNKDLFSVSHLLSDALIDSIKRSLSDKEQSLIFLNRRGTSRLILCEKCSWESLCPNCNLPLIYHGDQHHLRCHTCGFIDRQLPNICPNCGSDSILYTTIGTKAVVDEVQSLFTNARIRRFDTDNLKQDSVGESYQSIVAGEVDILIGTQQLAKGFDLPKLSTVGILQADTNLFIPDYTSEERGFQLVTQVLGRIGRGHINGRAVIQTFNTNSTILKSAINQDYDSFYMKEISDRERYKFPPFYSLLKLTVRRASAKSAEAACLKLKELIGDSSLRIEGPAPSFHEKIDGKFQWQLVVKSTNRRNLIDVIKILPTGWSYDIDPSNLL
jgi:primosomal protein N' (replication factor Y)